MIVAETLEVEKRNDLSKSVLRELRQNGQVPGVLYGKDTETATVSVSYSRFMRVLKDQGVNNVINLKLDGKQTPVLVQDYQRDSIKDALLHIDFKKVDMAEKLDTNVGVELDGEPEGARDGGIVQQQMRELDIRCLPGNIPETVKVDISAMQIGDALSISNLDVPKDVEILNDAGEMVVTVLPPATENAEETDEEQDEAEDGGEA